MLATLAREFPERVEPQPSLGLFYRFDVRTIVVRHVHPNRRGLNQNSLMKRVSHRGERLCQGHNSDEQS
jgi:hypothetical protein